MPTLELKIPPILVVIVFAITMFSLSLFIPSTSFNLPGKQIVLLALVVPGVALVTTGVFAFRANRTTIDPRIPNTTSALVVKGIYRFSRNPMYLGFLSILAGWAVHLSNVVAFALLPAFVAYITVFQIRPEEKVLLSKFGPHFTEYMASVRRWI